MGGGVSRGEYERIRKELLLREQVICSLQKRLADGTPRPSSLVSVDEIAAPEQVAPLAPQPRMKTQMKRTNTQNSGTFSSRYALFKKRFSDGILNLNSLQRVQHDRLDSNVCDAHSSGSKDKSRRVEVSAEVMPNRTLLSTKERVIYPKSESSRQLLLKILQSNVLFNGQSREEIRDCMDAFFPMRVDSGHLVIEQGAQGDNFYAVESGQLEILVSIRGAPSIRYGFLGPGLGFGELALLYNMPRAATIRAVSEVELWALERNTFREILASHKLDRLKRTLEILEKVAILSKLTSSEMKQVAAAMDWEEFEEKARIVQQGEVGEKFYIITKGEIVVTQIQKDTDEEKIIRSLTSGDHFGEMALFKDEMRSATCTAVTRVQCLTLERNHFIAMLGTLQELMDREPVNLETKGMGHRRTSAEALVDPVDYKYHMEILHEELEMLQTLGRGAFGRVRLVRHAVTNRAFALKCLVKSHIVENNLMEHVMNEKKVMLALDHPFILKLFTTYQDRTHLYFLVELALGGELFTYLRRKDHFDEPVTRFYIASVVLALQHIHSKQIVYRDLKPENILLDNEGFMKLADFGLAKHVTDRTWTLCGTPDYLAPEIILSKGHNKAVDYWSLGILIFELMTGSAPFYAQDPMQIYALIIQGNVKFPGNMSRASVDLVQKLLCQNPARRLGNMKHGMKDIINHRWFSNFMWDSLRTKSMKPPIVPQIQNDFDTSNFEDFRHEVEDTVGLECDWSPDF